MSKKLYELTKQTLGLVQQLAKQEGIKFEITGNKYFQCEINQKESKIFDKHEPARVCLFLEAAQIRQILKASLTPSIKNGATSTTGLSTKATRG